MDYYKDSGHLFAKIFHSFELPEFAKEGSYFDTLDELPDSSFADPINRVLPINDRANTYVSYGYACMQKHNPKIAAVIPQIEKAAAMFGISDSLKPLADRVEGMLSKVASAEPQWEGKRSPFQVVFGTPKIQKVAGCGKEHVETAICRFFEVFTQIPFDLRQKAAAELIVAAEENGSEVPEDLRKVAGQAESNYETFKGHTLLRVHFIRGESEKNAAIEVSRLTDPVEQLKALKEMDETHKLAHFYGRGVTDPHRSVFNTVKTQERLIAVGPKNYPYDAWKGAGCPFEQAMVAALGAEKTASLVAEGAPDLSGLTEQEASLLNIYLS